MSSLIRSVSSIDYDMGVCYSNVYKLVNRLNNPNKQYIVMMSCEGIVGVFLNSEYKRKKCNCCNKMEEILYKGFKDDIIKDMRIDLNRFRDIMIDKE